MKEQKLLVAIFFLAMFFGVLSPFVYYAQYSGIVQLGFIAFTALIAVFLVYYYGFHTTSEEREEERRSERWERFDKTAERAMQGYTLSQNILKDSVLESWMRLYAVNEPKHLQGFVDKEALEFLMHKPEKTRIRKSGEEFYRMMEKVFREEGIE
ncbi:MAG: hypothetical protein N3F63_01490 [Thermoplasmata archaeon]|nr:hypothetical protein [Thermoplasmata archaeon]